MIFKAQSSKDSITVDNKSLNDIQNITGQKTSSSGYVLLDGANGVYLPNNIEDLKGILSTLNSLVNMSLNLSEGVKNIPMAVPVNAPLCPSCITSAVPIANGLSETQNKIEDVQQCLK